MDIPAMLARLNLHPGKPSACRFTQTGRMRMRPGGAWLPFTASQTMRADPPEFAWDARVRMAPLVTARVTDALGPAGGRLVARVFGVPVMRASGAETDVGQLMRWLAELPWCPGGFSAPYISWRSDNPGKLTATARTHQAEAEVEFELGADGLVRRTRGLRPRIVGKAAVLTPWSGEYEGAFTAGEFTVPARARVTWHLPEGEFTYWEGRITSWRAD